MNSTEIMVEAIKQGHFSDVQTLLESEPGLAGARTADGISIIMLAAYYQEPEIARLLAERAASLDIFEASTIGNLSVVQELVLKNPELVTTCSADGYPPLGLACFFGHQPVAAFLLSAGAQVNQPSENRMQVMPLHAAVARMDVDIARLLLMAGADPNARQADDFTPLHGAAQNGQLEMVELLLEFGADPGVLKSDGKTALDLAAEFQHPVVVEFLKKHKT